MSREARLRIMLRWIHMGLGLVLMCYIYSPFGKEVLFKRAVQFAVIPLIILTGLWIWKFKAFNHFLRIDEK